MFVYFVKTRGVDCYYPAEFIFAANGIQTFAYMFAKETRGGLNQIVPVGVDISDSVFVGNVVVQTYV